MVSWPQASERTVKGSHKCGAKGVQKDGLAAKSHASRESSLRQVAQTVMKGVVGRLQGEGGRCR